MEVDVKYQSQQQAKEKLIGQLLQVFRELLGVEVKIGERMKDKDINENSEKEFDKLMRDSLKKRSDEKIFTSSPSLYELSFIKKMISGEFISKSVNDFTTKKDKRLFEKYNSLGTSELEEQFSILLKNLEKVGLK